MPKEFDIEIKLLSKSFYILYNHTFDYNDIIKLIILFDWM